MGATEDAGMRRFAAGRTGRICGGEHLVRRGTRAARLELSPRLDLLEEDCDPFEPALCGPLARRLRRRHTTSVERGHELARGRIRLSTEYGLLLVT